MSKKLDNMDETYLNTMIVFPNIGRITIRDALDKGLLGPPPSPLKGRPSPLKNRPSPLSGKTLEEIHGVEKARELKEHLSKLMTGRKRPDVLGDKNPSKRPEVKEKISKALKGRKCPWLEGDKSPTKRPEVREKISKTLTGRKQTAEHNANMIKGLTGRKATPEHIANMSAAMTEKRKDSKFAKMMLESRHEAPNNLEKRFNKLLQLICPDEFWYAGNGEFWIGGKCPDFKHVSKKKLIEVFGDYWHKGKDPQERIDFFKMYGYDTLVIWEYEIWDEPEEVAKKVLMFIH